MVSSYARTRETINDNENKNMKNIRYTIGSRAMTLAENAPVNSKLGTSAYVNDRPTAAKADKIEKPAAPKKAVKAKGPKTPAVAKSKKVKKSTATTKVSKCSFIDDLLEQGDLTLSQILEKALAKFPQATKQATMGTIRARPAHMRKAGKVPKWLPEADEVPAAK
jgi:hypothetical protein